MSARRANALIWFGVSGGALAWIVQHVASVAFGFAQCNQPAARWELPVHGWQIGVGAAAFVVGLAAEAVSAWVFLRTRDGGEGSRPKGIGEEAGSVGRIHFLATIGLTVNFLSLAIIIMDAIGAPLLPLCQQS